MMLPHDSLLDIVTFLAQDPTVDTSVLLRVSRQWFAITGSILYANPARHILLRYEGHEETRCRFNLLLNTLLHCTPVDSYALYHPHFRQVNNALLGRPLTTNYLQWVSHLDKDWHFMQNLFLPDFLDGPIDITIPLVHHHPSSVQHLCLKACSISKLYPLVPGLVNLRSLELVSIESWTEAADAIWFASALQAEHGLLYQFRMDAKNHEHPLGAKPLDLAFLHSVRSLDLGAWSGKVGLSRLPTAHLRHLHISFLPSYTVEQLCALFDSCPQLESLAVNLHAKQGFQWAALSHSGVAPASLPTQTRLPRLCSLHLQGDRFFLPPALQEALDIWGAQLESLKVELTGGLVEKYRRQLGWSVPMHRLQRLSLMDKALFAFVGNSMEYCPNVTHLMLHIDAERDVFHSIPDPGMHKWVFLGAACRGMTHFLKNLKELRLGGCWIGSHYPHLTELHSLERLVVGTALQRPVIEPLAGWIKTMPGLRYALLPVMGQYYWRKDENSTWLPLFERVGLAIEVQERGIRWEA